MSVPRDMIKGSKWWRVDLHVHTPGSQDYGRGDEALKGMAPRDWLLSVMQKEVDCVAIADHNTGKWIDKLKSELAVLDALMPEGYRPLHLLPGVEISAGAIHVLAIFDHSMTTEGVSSILGSVGFLSSRMGETEREFPSYSSFFQRKFLHFRCVSLYKPDLSASAQM